MHLPLTHQFAYTLKETRFRLTPRPFFGYLIKATIRCLNDAGSAVVYRPNRNRTEKGSDSLAKLAVHEITYQAFLILNHMYPENENKIENVDVIA